MIKRIKSTKMIEKYENKTNLKDFLVEKANNKLGGNCLMIVYKYTEVYIASIQNGIINTLDDDNFTLDYITEIRMFSEKGELHLWKYGDDYKWRLRIDGEAGEEEVNVYEEEHFIWGTKINENGINVIEEEHRGIKIKFPYELNDKDLPMLYEVRNYFTYDEDGMIQFYDARLVKIKYKTPEV